MPPDADLPVIPTGEEVAPVVEGSRRRPWPRWVLPLLVAVVAFGAGQAVGRAQRPAHPVVVSNPCPEAKEVAFFDATTAGSSAGLPLASAVFTMTVPPYSARVVPGAGRLAPGWTYVVPVPNTRPLGGRFQGQISRGDLATGELWFPSELCDN